MITILVNGSPFAANTATVRTMGDLVELVKTTIDPETIITSIQIEGRELSDGDWRSPLASHGEGTLSISTGSKLEFLAERLQTAPLYIDKIIDGFKQVKLNFRSGSQAAGNQDLKTTVQDLKAFVDWYNTVLDMLPERLATEKDRFITEVRALTDVCEQVLQQQLYRAWWALHETIERRLLPALEQLKSCTLSIFKSFEN